jgi:hypothetical protein
MASADNWPLHYSGSEHSYPYVDIGDGVRLFDVRGRWSDGFGEGSGTEKIGFAVHHAVGGLGSGTLESDLAIMDAIHNSHTVERGWEGIGYHRIIGAGKRAYLIGPSASVRAHVANLNHLWIGVCFLGTWTDSRPDEDRMTAFKRLVQWETDQRGMPMQLAPHKRLNLGSTACPGGWARQDAWLGTSLQPMALAPPVFEPPVPPVFEPSPQPFEIDDFQRGRKEMYEAWLRDAESYAEYVKARREAWGIPG